MANIIYDDYNNYIASLTNLKKMIKKIDGLFNIDEYKKELDIVLQEVEELNGKARWNFYTDKINYITEKLNENYCDLYQIHLSTVYIESLFENIVEDNIQLIIDEVKKLIKCISDYNLKNNEDEKKIFDRVYEVIYKALLCEEVYNMDDLYKHILSSKNQLIIENIGSLIEKDMKDLPKSEVAKIELDNIKLGLGYDFVNQGYIICFSTNYGFNWFRFFRW